MTENEGAAPAARMVGLKLFDAWKADPLPGKVPAWEAGHVALGDVQVIIGVAGAVTPNPVQVHAGLKQGRSTVLAVLTASPSMLLKETVAMVAVLVPDALKVTAALESWAVQTARPHASANKTKHVLMFMIYVWLI